MTEIDYLKLKLEDKEKAFDKLHKLHMESLKKQGELEEENEQLKRKNMYFLKIMFALKNYVENEDYEQIEKVIDKIKKEMI